MRGSSSSFSPQKGVAVFGGEDESAHLHPKNVLGVMALEESPLGGLALQQVCAHSHLPAGDVRPEALAYPSEREVSTLRRTAEVVRQETCSVPNELTAKFDSRTELSTYRGQWSQVELPLDFQLENNEDGGAFSRAGPAVVQQENIPLLSSASGKTQWGNPEITSFIREPQPFRENVVFGGKNQKLHPLHLFSLLSLEKTQSSDRLEARQTS